MGFAKGGLASVGSRLGVSYPNCYVARLASKFVKVCLSGAGGDELYAGYPWRYHRTLDALERDDYLRTFITAAMFMKMFM